MPFARAPLRFAVAAVAAILIGSPAQALVWPDVPERVEHKLASSDPVTRRSGARELVSLGPARATPLLLHALEDTDTDVRLAAADAAIRLRVGAATPAVLPWTNGPVPALRVKACEVASALPDPHAVPALARALADAEVSVRAAAAAALGAYAGVPDAVPPLLGKLDDASPGVRAVIAQSLARLRDERAVVPLVGKVHDSVPEVRGAVARALGDLGDPRAAQALLLQLRDNVVDVRLEALAALGKLRAADAVDAIAPLAVDRSPALRQAAISTLGRIGTPAAVRALVATLGQGDEAGGGLERTPAREALVAAGRARRSRRSRRSLERPANAAAATSAAWILGELHAHERAPAIIAAMRRGVLPPAAALHALGGAGTSDSLPVVLEFIGDPSPLVRDKALDAAAALLDPATPDGRAVEPLTAALRDTRLGPSDRASVAGLLGRTGAARAAPVLAELARAKGPAVRLAAIDAIGTLGPAAAARPEDLEPVIEALGDADPGVRLHAAVALADAGDARARDAILAKLDAVEVDRGAVLAALGGVLARAPSDAALARLAHELELAAGPERDAIAGALGRAHHARRARRAERLAASPDPDDARTAATLLAAHADDPRALAVARTLLARTEAVRASPGRVVPRRDRRRAATSARSRPLHGERGRSGRRRGRDRSPGRPPSRPERRVATLRDAHRSARLRPRRRARRPVAGEVAVRRRSRRAASPRRRPERRGAGRRRPRRQPRPVALARRGQARPRPLRRRRPLWQRRGPVPRLERPARPHPRRARLRRPRSLHHPAARRGLRPRPSRRRAPRGHRRPAGGRLRAARAGRGPDASSLARALSRAPSGAPASSPLAGACARRGCD